MSIMGIIRFIIHVIKTFAVVAASSLLFVVVLGRTIAKMWM